MSVIQSGDRVYIHPGCAVPQVLVDAMVISIKDVPEIVETTLMNSEVVERLLYKDPRTGQPIRKEADIPFYRLQNRFLLGENLLIDPTSIEDYIAQGGYQALWKALKQMSPEQIIEEVKRSRLRGRGGGGFPTGRKWEAVARSPVRPHYLVCNADEAEPGTFNDCVLMEEDSFALIEAMTIAGLAIGAEQGFIYIRGE